MLTSIALAVALGSSQNDSSCWDIAYAAVRKRAAAPHPKSILYDAKGTVTEDGVVLLRTQQSITYRDDGSAIVADDRFDQPYVVQALDPGPPELGPYGGRRLGWLLPEEPAQSLRVIAKVQAVHQIPCRNNGIVRYHGRDVYELIFGSPRHQAALQKLWVDVQSNDIWKVVLRNNDIDFNIEMEQSGPYLVVRHVSWQYEMKVFSQTSNVAGEYFYNDFSFPPS